MWRSTLLALAFLILCPLAFSQSTTVSGTITDTPDGQAWFGGTFSFVFRVNPNNPVGPYFWNGAPFSTSQTIAGALDASAHYSTSVPSNSAITPAGSTWDVTFCPLASAQCVTFNSTTITGATQTFAPSPPSIRLNLAVPLQNPKAYTDTEVLNGALGQTYYNLINNSTRLCTSIPCGWSNNVIGTVIPPSLGGTGTGTPAAHGVAVGEGPVTPFNFILPTNNGQCFMSAPSNFATTDPSYQTCPSGGGGGGSSTGPQGTVQEAGSVGGSFAVSPFLDIGGAGTDVQESASLETKGPNPMVSVALFGAKPTTLSAPGLTGATATCTATNTSVPVGGTFFTKFVNGDGVTLYNCGPSHSMSTPSAPTVTAAVAGGPTGTGIVATNASAGSTTRCYKIVARDQAQGLTAASPEACVTTGSAVLGSQSVNVTSCSRSGQTVTCVTSAHTLPIGCSLGSCGSIHISGTSDDKNFSGWFPLNSVADSTHFTYIGGLLDANGATTSATGGTFQYYNSDHLTLPAYTAGQWQYGIYEGASGAETLVDVSTPNISGLASQPTFNTWDWYGSTYGGGVSLPAFWPTNPPSSATNDSLTTTVVSGGGTSTLVLAVAPSNTPGSATTILYDSCPGIKAAFAFANSTLGGGGMVEFPAVANNGGSPSYFINSYCALSGAVSQAMPITLGDTMQFVGQWWGSKTLNTVSLIAPQFFIEGHIPIFNRSAKPGVYFQGGRWDGVHLQAFGNSYISMFYSNGGQPSIFLDDSFSPNNTSVDFNGIALYDVPPFQGGFGWRMDNVAFQAGPNLTSGSSFTPYIVSKYNFEINIQNTPMSARGIFYACPPAGSNFSYRMGNEIQGGTAPLLMFSGSGGGNCAGWVDLYGTWIDTDSEPIATNLSGGTGVGNFGATLMIHGSNVSNGRVGISGAPFAAVAMDGFAGLSTVIGQNVNIHYTDSFTGWVVNNTQVLMGHAQSLYVLGSVPPAPTCSTATAGPPFTQAFGASTFAYAPIFFGGTYFTTGTFSPPSNSCTSNGTTQQVTVTIPAAIPGAIGYRIDKGGFSFSAAGGCSAILTTLVNIMGQNCGTGEAALPQDGPAAIFDQTIRTNFIFDGQYMDMAEIPTPANPGTGVGRLTVNSTTNLLTCQLSTGVSCMPPGTTPGGLVNAIQSNGGGGTLQGTNPPAGPGIFGVIYDEPTSATTAPAIRLPGVSVNAQTGTTYTIGSANYWNDRATVITASNSSAQTYTAVNPSAAGFGFSMPYIIKNIGTGAVTENSSGFNINGGTSLLIPPSWTAFHWSDNTNYIVSRLPDFGAFPNCTGGGNALQFTTATGVFSCGASSSGVSSWSGDGALYNNSLSTGVVTATLANAAANTVWGRCLGTSGTPSYCQITDAMLTAVSHAALTNQANTYTGGGLQDFSAVTWKIPTGAGFTATASSMLGYDSTNKNPHIYSNNADSIVGAFASAPTNGDCLKAVVVSGNVQIGDAGASCNTATSALSSITAATTSNTIASGNNGAQVWNWALTTNQVAFTFGETTAATSGTLGNQYITKVTTAAGSTAVPLNVGNSLSGSQTLPSLHITPTWNTTGIVDAALLINPTNTASGTGSLLADFQLGGTSQWKVDKAGNSTQLGSVATGSSPPTCTAGTAGAVCYTEGTAATAASSVDDLHADSTQHAMMVNNNNTGEMAISRVVCVNVTPVTVSTSTTSDQNLMSCSLNANVLNVATRTLKIKATGVYSNVVTSAPTVNMKAKLCTVSGCGSGTVINLVSITTTATPATAVTSEPASLELLSITQTAGASSAYEAHGSLAIDLGTVATAADSIFLDTNTATVGTIDSTGALFLQITVAFSAASTSNSFTERQLVVEVLN